MEQPTVGQRLQKLLDVAAGQGGVLSRKQLYAAGVARGEVRWQVRAHRWQRVGRQSIYLHTGTLSRVAQLWSAVFEGGPRAFLDGTSSLIASGLSNYTEDQIRVSVPKGSRVVRRRTPGLDIRETRRYRADDVIGTGVPRSRVEVAAVRGALWAKSDRQAALILTMVVQQGMCRAEALGVEMLQIRRDKRRSLLHGVILDLMDGVRSLGERDLVNGCRERGLPEPDKQVLYRARSGKYYLDFRWAVWGVVVEVDGIQHAWAENLVGDALRHNAVAIAGDTVLRLPLLGLRVAPAGFFDQIEAALRARGWNRNVVA
jgi:very-short-patch-repair endonuclease